MWCGPGGLSSRAETGMMRTGGGWRVVYGLIAALGWGLSAVAATNAARRAGTYLAVLSGQGLGVIALLLLTILFRPSFAAAAGMGAPGPAGSAPPGLACPLPFFPALPYR